MCQQKPSALVDTHVIYCGDNLDGRSIRRTNGTGGNNPEPFVNSRAFKFANLPRGKDVWVRVRARNVVGPGPWSDPATIMVA
jgi:hypothetical protein